MLDTIIKFLFPFLSKLTLSNGVVLLIILLFLVIILYIISSIIGKPLEIGLGRIKLSFFGSGEKRENKKEQSKEKLIAEKIKNVTKEITTNIINSEYKLLKEQLDYSEYKIEELRSELSSDYYNLFKNNNNEEDFKQNKEYRNFQVMLNFVMNRCIIKFMKKCFKENHLNDLVNSNWDVYLEQRSEISINQMYEFLELIYDNYNNVSKKDLMDMCEINKERYKKTIKNIFIHSKRLSIENIKKIEKMNNELDTRIKNILEEC